MTAMAQQNLLDETTKPLVDGSDGTGSESKLPELVTCIPTVPVTLARKPFAQAAGAIAIPNAGTARANIAPSTESPHGTMQGDWAAKHRHQTVLQQHCDFFDADGDGIIWPSDTFRGFRKLGFGVVLSLLAMVVIHVNFAYPTQRSWVPDPRLLVHVDRIHKNKHGSDSGVYDGEGRFVPQHFENIFAKYADGRDYVTGWDIVNLWNGNKMLVDPIGWGAAFFEWLATYLMLWPEDGRIMKEDIRGIYDGSIFYTIAARRTTGRPASTRDVQHRMDS